MVTNNNSLVGTTVYNLAQITSHIYLIYRILNLHYPFLFKRKFSHLVQ